MHRFLAALLLCCAAAAPAAAALVTINSSLIASSTRTTNSIDTSTATGSRSVTSSVGGSSATTLINWQVTDTGALFDFDFDHVRSGTGASQSVENFLKFTVGSSNVSYSLTGLYAMTGPANFVFSWTTLRESGGSLLFEDWSWSRNTADEFFSLGVADDGDYSNRTSGSLTGTLLAGRTYEFFFNNFINSDSGADDGATATGCVTLSIGGATGGGDCGVPTVPLPAAAWLLFSGLAGLGVLGRRRKAA